jgi:hypothetical protein
MVRYVLVIWLLAVAALAQNLPDAPSYVFTPSDLPLEGIVPNPEVPHHRFLDKGNRVRLIALAGIAAADGITTQRLMTAYHGQELNPLARPLVTKGAAGQAAASLLGYGLSAGTAFLFHRTNHHRMERMVLNLSIGIEGECVVHNMIQIATGNPQGASATQSQAP